VIVVAPNRWSRSNEKGMNVMDEQQDREHGEEYVEPMPGSPDEQHRHADRDHAQQPAEGPDFGQPAEETTSDDEM